MRHTLTATLALSLLAASAAEALPLFNDTFESETLGLNQSLDNWSVSDGAIDVVGDGFFDFSSGNGKYIDLDGSIGDAGKITTNTLFNFLAGNYILTFQLGGSTRIDTNSVTVALGSFYSEVFTLASNAGLQNITRSFSLGAAAGTGALSFENAGGDHLGLLLDDVSLDFNRPSSGPEPSTIALLSMGGLLAVARHRRAQTGVGC